MTRVENIEEIPPHDPETSEIDRLGDAIEAAGGIGPALSAALGQEVEIVKVEAETPESVQGTAAGTAEHPPSVVPAPSHDDLEIPDFLKRDDGYGSRTMEDA